MNKGKTQEPRSSEGASKAWINSMHAGEPNLNSETANQSDSGTTIYQRAVQKVNEAKEINEPIFTEMIESSLKRF